MFRLDESEIESILSSVKLRASADLESDILEFKAFRDERSLHNSKELAEEISAFANTKGGTIIIGVKDSSNIPYGQWDEQLVGISDVDLTTTKERIRGKLQPEIDIIVSQFDFEGKSYLIIEVPHRHDTLVSTRSGKTLIRDGRSSRPMSPYEIKQAVKSLTSYDWSDEVLSGVNAINVLDPVALSKAIADFSKRRDLEELTTPEAYLEAIGATKQGHLTSGGLIFLGKEDEIRNYLGDFEYRFSWKGQGGELIVNDVWGGCIWNTIERAKKHFEECNQIGQFKSGNKEFNAPLLDEVAFHEAYLNAVVHRDYSAEGMISVNFTGNLLKITSPGLFYGGITAENIARHEPRHRNKALARILMTHRLVDRAGMGVIRMGIRSLMYGRTFPRFGEDFDSVEVTLQAEYLRPGITVLSLEKLGYWGIPELLIINSVYETGAVGVEDILRRLSRVSVRPWQDLLNAVDRIDQVELCGTKQGIFIRVTRFWRDFFKVAKTLKVPTTSEKHVRLYKYLKRHGEAANSDLTKLLEHKYSSQTSKFLRDSEYVRRRGSGVNAIWFIAVNNK